MKKCLIIDDVEVTRFTSEQIVQSLGLQTAAVASIDEANDALSKENYDCILLDWHIRKLSGLEYLKVLKSGPYSHIKVIVFSGVEGTDKQGEALQAGASAFIAKPTTKEKLTESFKGLSLL